MNNTLMNNTLIFEMTIKKTNYVFFVLTQL